MASTKNLHLSMTPEGTNKSFLDWRLEQDGTENSNMQKLDAAWGDMAARVDGALAAVGKPTVAETAADMTDQTRAYVYTGSETGYTYGNWYYYDAEEEAWVSGGVYQASAVETDETLRVEGMAADAKATGELVAINETPMAGTKISITTTSEDVTLATMDDVDELKTQIVDVTGNTVYENFNVGRYIDTSGDYVDINTLVSNGSRNCIVVDCAEDDVFTITGHGAALSAVLYTFAGAETVVESKTVRPVIKKTTANFIATDLILTTPANAEKLIINVAVDYPYYFCKGKAVKLAFSDINALSTQMNAEIGYLHAGNPSINGFTVTGGKFVSAGDATFGTLRNDEDASYTDYIPVVPNSIIKVEKAYVYGARGIISYDSEYNAIRPALATNSGISGVTTEIITIPETARYIRISGKVSEGSPTASYLSVVRDGNEAEYSLICNTAADGNYISGASGDTPGDENSCCTDFVRVRPYAHVIVKNLYLTSNRSVYAYGKNKGNSKIRSLIGGSSAESFEFDVTPDIYYIRATGHAGTPPEIYMSDPTVADTKEFLKESHILMPYANRDSVCRKIVTYVDDDALNETGMDLLKASCDNLGIKCSISAIGKILETTPSRVTYLKALEAEGFHICNHSYDHSRWYEDYGGETMFTLAEVEEDLIKSMQTLNSLGFIDAAKFFVYPGSSQTRAGIERIIKKWCELGCTISDGNNRIENIPRTYLYRCHIDQSLHADVDYYKTQLTNLTVENGNNWIIYYSHCKNYNVEGGDWRQTLFEDVMENALEEGYTAMTLNEAWNYRKSMWMVQEAFGI